MATGNQEILQSSDNIQAAAAGCPITPVMIWDFTCPRQYLKYRYQDDKNRDSGVSWPAFAQQLDISLPLLKMLVAGKRQFTIPQIHRIAARLKLSYEEQTYWNALVLRSQATLPEEKSFYERQIASLKATSGKTPSTTPRVAFSTNVPGEDWYIPALMVYLLDVAKVQDAPLNPASIQKMANKLGTSEETIRSILKRLEAIGVLRHKNGSVVLSLDNIKSPISGKRFVRKITEEALGQIKSNYGREDAFFFASAVSLLDHEVVAYRERIKEVSREFSSRPRHDHDGLEVYQFISHLWPVELF